MAFRNALYTVTHFTHTLMLHTCGVRLKNTFDAFSVTCCGELEHVEHEPAPMTLGYPSMLAHVRRAWPAVPHDNAGLSFPKRQVHHYTRPADMPTPKMQVSYAAA